MDLFISAFITLRSLPHVRSPIAFPLVSQAAISDPGETGNEKPGLAVDSANPNYSSDDDDDDCGHNQLNSTPFQTQSFRCQNMEDKDDVTGVFHVEEHSGTPALFLPLN